MISSYTDGLFVIRGGIEPPFNHSNNLYFIQLEFCYNIYDSYSGSCTARYGPSTNLLRDDVARVPSTLLYIPTSFNVLFTGIASIIKELFLYIL
jgi:hypothetical protein